MWSCLCIPCMLLLMYSLGHNERLMIYVSSVYSAVGLVNIIPRLPCCKFPFVQCLVNMIPLQFISCWNHTITQKLVLPFTDYAKVHPVLVSIGLFSLLLNHLVSTGQHLTFLSIVVLCWFGGIVAYAFCYQVRTFFSLCPEEQNQVITLRSVTPLPCYEPRLQCYKYSCNLAIDAVEGQSHDGCTGCQCEVCCHSYNQKYVVCAGKCGHVFHKHCMLRYVQYLLEHKHLSASILFLRCMVCRQRLTNQPNDYYLCLKFIEGIIEVTDHPTNLVYSLDPNEEHLKADQQV